MEQLKPCPFCNKDWGISDPDTGRHWLHKINYCPICGKRLNRRVQSASELLTLDELREMDGEPVWIQDGIGKGWFLVGGSDGEALYFYEKMLRVGEPITDYGKTWLAYRTKPEEATP